MTNGGGMPEHASMAGGREFDAIRALLATWGPVACGIGDDAALLPSAGGGTQVISTDCALEGVHFEAGWLSPPEIGARAVAAALSDLAAMGARAQSVLVALQVPPHWEASLADVAMGIGRVVQASDAHIIGGNLSRASQFGITCTVVGCAERPVRRAGACVGDALWVTGSLGGPGRAVAAWQRGETPAASDRDRFAAPTPRLREGMWLAAAGVHAMIDVSDGIAADAQHLAAASGVCCTIWPHALPRVAGATVEEALFGGEEYELLVASDADFDVDAFEQRFRVPLTRVGTVTAHDATAAPRVDLPAGHDHFSS